MRILRSLLSLFIVLALFGGGITYALTPSDSIKSSEKLANVRATTSVEDLNGNFVSNLKLVDSKISTSLKINNNIFLSIFKNSLPKSSELLEGSYSIVGDHIEAKLPVKLGIWDTLIDTKVKVVGANNSVDFVLEDAKIGKVPIPDFALEKYLKEALSGSGAGVSGNINVTASLSQQQALKYTTEAFNSYRRV